MRRHISLIDPRSGATVDAVLDAPPDTSGPDLEVLLGRTAPAPGPFHLRGRPLPPHATFEQLGVVEGEPIGCGGPVPSPRITSQQAGVELRVTGGPGPGTVFLLGDGVWTVGREGDLRIPDEFLSRRHLELRVAGIDVSCTDLGSANGTEVDGATVEEASIGPGTTVRAGNTLFEIAPASQPELSLLPGDQGTLGFNRRFRAGDDALATEVAFPELPVAGERPSLNLVLTIVPAAVAAGVSIVLGRPEYLLFAGLGPVMGVGNAITRRRAHDRRQRTAAAANEAEMATAQARLSELRKEEARRSRVASPDVASVVQCARAAQRQLWARRPGDDDFLRVRVGAASLRSAVGVRSAGASDLDHGPADLWMAPLTVDLPQVGGMAIVGSDVARARALARSLVLQATTLHSPAELRVVVLAGDAREDDWGWTKWLPHTRWAADEAFNLIGSDTASTQARFTELRDLIKRRQDIVLQQRQASFSPTVLVVYDEFANLLPFGAADILRDGAAVGIHAIAVDRSHVPEGCNASLTLGLADDDAVFEQAGRTPTTDVLVDGVQPPLCSTVALALAPLRLLGEETANELPQALRLLDLLELDGADAARVATLWSTSSRRGVAPVGLSLDGVLDLDLTRDGPHAVIAGASRSGKSEFLKTLIASLAATNHPDDLSFVFIDFKGGNDYQLAALLPHTVELATQQDRAGFERSLRLLDAEIVRRQRVCRELQTSTLEGYWAAQASAISPTPTLGRLVVVVDEFAEVAQKSPEQIERLVSVARVGAAFGVHLLLATQNPTGVVSGQIDANAPLRVCFRTTQPEHSAEVIGSAVAASILERHRGRGFKRAHGEPAREFQCARVGNARPGSDASSAPASITRWTWTAAGHPPVAAANVGEVPDPETDLFDLVQAVTEAAGAAGWTQCAVPWPKPLPTHVAVTDFEGPASTASVPFALEDDPDNQRRVERALVLGEGHLAIAGGMGSGRTSALRTIGAAIATALPADAAHLFVIDHRGGGLTGLAELPHTGGVASSDPELTTRILTELEGQLGRRKASFERTGAASLAEHNAASDEALPWLVLLIDGWELLHEESQTASGSVLHDRILRLLAEGQRLGLQAVLAGDRWVGAGKVGRLMTHRYVLRFELESDYDLLGIRSSMVPDTMPAGRALDPGGRSLQVAVLGDGSGPGQAGALRTLAKQLHDRDAALASSTLPVRIRPLPTRVDLASLRAATASPTGSLAVLLGLGADGANVRWIDLAVDGAGFLVGGRRRSGRSNTLVTFGTVASSLGTQVVAIPGKPASLAGLHGLPGVVEITREGLASSDLAALCAGRPTLVLIDDAELFEGGDPQLVAVAQRTGAELAVVAAGSSEHLRTQITGFLPFLRRSRSGLVLCPETPYDGGVLGAANLPRNLVFDGPPGRAVVAVNGELEIVQIADAT